MDKKKKVSLENLHHLIKFIPDFENPNFCCVQKWPELGDLSCYYHPKIDEFEACLYDHDLIIIYDWTKERSKFTNEFLCKADLESVLKYFTAIFRAERFCAGAVAGEFDSGNFMTALNRLKEVSHGG